MLLLYAILYCKHTCTREAGLVPRLFVTSEIDLRAERDIHACLPQYGMFRGIIMVITRPISVYLRQL
jgi:hypothetical protein